VRWRQEIAAPPAAQRGAALRAQPNGLSMSPEMRGWWGGRELWPAQAAAGFGFGFSFLLFC